MLAVAELDGPSVHVYDVRSGSDEPMDSFKVHRAPVTVMRYNAAHDTVISIDQKGKGTLKRRTWLAATHICLFQAVAAMLYHLLCLVLESSSHLPASWADSYGCRDD